MLSPAAFVQAASDEMDSKLGSIYVVPIDVSTVQNYVWLRLKNINLKLASGRLLMAMDAAGEHTALHSYGSSLVSEAMQDLACIVGGRDELAGAPRVANPSSVDGDGPTILNADRQSGVDAFYDYVNRPGWEPNRPSVWTPWWRPGPAGGYGPVSGDNTPQPGTRDPDPGGLRH